MKKRIIIALLLVALILSAASCVRADSKDDEQTTDSVTEAFVKTDEDVFEIETPYATLKFPVKWQKYVKAEGVQNTLNYSVTFTAVFGEKTLTLYTIVFGDSTNGYKLGTLKAEDGDVNVYLVDTYDAAAETLSADEFDVYGEMYKDVNVIISKLVYDDGLVLAD